jgi:hypothetical protein
VNGAGVDAEPNPNRGARIREDQSRGNRLGALGGIWSRVYDPQINIRRRLLFDNLKFYISGNVLVEEKNFGREQVGQVLIVHPTQKLPLLFWAQERGIHTDAQGHGQPRGPTPIPNVPDIVEIDDVTWDSENSRQGPHRLIALVIPQELRVVLHIDPE